MTTGHWDTETESKKPLDRFQLFLTSSFVDDKHSHMKSDDAHMVFF